MESKIQPREGQAVLKPSAGHTPPAAPPPVAPPVAPQTSDETKPIYVLRSRPTEQHRHTRVAVIFATQVTVRDVICNVKGWRIESLAVGPTKLFADAPTGIKSEMLAAHMNRPPVELVVPAGAELAVRAKYTRDYPPVSQLLLELYGAPQAPPEAPADAPRVTGEGTILQLLASGPAKKGEEVHVHGELPVSCRIESLIGKVRDAKDWVIHDLRIQGLSALPQAAVDVTLEKFAPDFSPPIAVVAAAGYDIELVATYLGSKPDTLRVDLVGKMVK